MGYQENDDKVMKEGGARGRGLEEGLPNYGYWVEKSYLLQEKVAGFYEKAGCFEWDPFKREKSPQTKSEGWCC